MAYSMEMELAGHSQSYSSQYIYMFESHTKNLRSAPALIDHVTTRSSLKKLALKSSRLGALLFFKENNTDLISYSTTSLTKELRTRFKFQLFIQLEQQNWCPLAISHSLSLNQPYPIAIMSHSPWQNQRTTRFKSRCLDIGAHQQPKPIQNLLLVQDGCSVASHTVPLKAGNWLIS